jgi:hypothetical protein
MLSNHCFFKGVLVDWAETLLVSKKSIAMIEASPKRRILLGLGSKILTLCYPIVTPILTNC